MGNKESTRCIGDVDYDKLSDSQNEKGKCVNAVC